MENRPEYVATWLGLAKIGVVPALINYNLKEKALVHSIEAANCKAMIYGAELSSGLLLISQRHQRGQIDIFYCRSVRCTKTSAQWKSSHISHLFIWTFSSQQSQRNSRSPIGFGFGFQGASPYGHSKRNQL